MLLFLFFIFILNTNAIIVFERKKITGGITTSITPSSIPVLGLKYARQTPKSNEDTSLSYDRFTGEFTSISATSGISFKLPNSTIITHQLNEFIEHPAFSFGSFIEVDGPIIASAVRRKSASNFGNTFTPSIYRCAVKSVRDPFLWYVSAYYPIRTQPFNATEECPNLATYYFLFKSETQIGSAEIAPNPNPSPIGIGCFDDTDPAVGFGKCITESSRRYCVEDQSCVTTEEPRTSLKNMHPFTTAEYGAVESIRILRDNVFPFEESTTVGMTGTTSPTFNATSDATLRSMCMFTLGIILLVF